MQCHACATENRSGSRFCDQCGSALAVSCPACGEPNRSDARFCSGCGTVLTGEQPQPSPNQPTPATAERRLVSVLFTDLVGFTTLAEDRDPEAVRDLLSRYFDRATELVELHGGTVEKFIGDAVMAVWGTPVAHEDDAERAVRAALELVEAVSTLDPGLQARAGVLTGEAAVTLGATNQSMVAGNLVNTAARLQGAAEPGTVLVGDATRQAAERSILFEPIGDTALKGRTSPVPAWRAVRVVANRGGQGRSDALEPPFVGRDEELRQLKEVLHGVERERRPRLVSVTGSGGIGKSRLVWELEKYVDGVSENILWHRGRSPSYGQGITFWALGEMVRRRADLTEDADAATTRDRVAATLDTYLPDPAERARVEPALLSLLGVADAPSGGRDTLFPAWRLFFERVAERGTTVLVFEDVHWADTGLLDFIDHLLDWARSLPIVVVTLARPELFDRRPDWGAGRGQVTALALERLRDADVHQMLAGLVPGLSADVLAAIVGRAEGIPLYAVEMVRGLLSDGLVERRGDVYAPTGDLSKMRVPDTLRSLIASRLDSLEPADRTLLQDAAVLGQVFGLDSLAAVVGSDPGAVGDRLKSLARRELVDVERDPQSPERGRYRFVQALIREVAYGTLGRRDRRARHLAVARHFEALGDEELAGALASHYVAAHEYSEPGEEADAVAAQARVALGAAASRAASLGSHDQAIAYLEQALPMSRGPSERALLLDRAAMSASTAARADAEKYGFAAVEAYRQLGDRAQVAEATARLARALIDAGEIERARDVLEAARPEAEQLEDEGPLAAVLANLARAAMRLSDVNAAIASADGALAIAERLNLEAVIAEALVNKGSALNILGRRRESIGLHRAALDIARQVGDRGLELRIRNNLSSALGEDDPVAAARMLAEGVEIARNIGDRVIYHFQLSMLSVAHLDEGVDWDEDLEALRGAYESATLRNDRLRLRSFIGLFEAARGVGVEDMLRDIEGLAAGHQGLEDRVLLAFARSEAARRQHDYETAFELAMDAVALGYQSPHIAITLGARAAAHLGDAERVRTIAGQAERLQGSGTMTRVRREQIMAMLAAAEGDAEAATTAFLDIQARLESLRQRYLAAVFLIDALAVLPNAGTLRQQAGAARALLEELRATADLEDLDRVLGMADSASVLARPAQGIRSARGADARD